MTFVYFHIGPKGWIPTLLTRSIRAHFPTADIVQCTDATTPAIEGVTHVHRCDGMTRDLMTFRLNAFSTLGLTEPAAYIDTDMLMIKAVDVAELLDGRDVAVCTRSFEKDEYINPALFGLDFSEYRGKTFGEIYPYLACFTATRSHDFWGKCREELLSLPEKFQCWYGDQEAIRNVVAKGVFSVQTVPDRLYGCLPEFMDPSVEVPCMLHFKGSERKKLLRKWANSLNLGRL